MKFRWSVASHENQVRLSHDGSQFGRKDVGWNVHEVVKAEDASTVMVLRDEAGLEVFCVWRNPKLSTWGGAVAFPGGKVDEGDFDAAFENLCTPVHPRLKAYGHSTGLTRAVAVAAVRELMEEVCVLPVLFGATHERVRELRDACQEGFGFQQVLAREGVRVDLSGLRPVARWATPKTQDRRFDARFFVMRLPVGQVGSNDEKENMECRWSRPAEMLELFKRGDIQLVPPTQWMLNMLSKFEKIDDVFEFAGRQSLRGICPELSVRGPEVRLVLPGHPDHHDSTRCLEGPTSFDLSGGRFVLNLKN